MGERSECFRRNCVNIEEGRLDGVIRSHHWILHILNVYSINTLEYSYNSFYDMIGYELLENMMISDVLYNIHRI